MNKECQVAQSTVSGAFHLKVLEHHIRTEEVDCLVDNILSVCLLDGGWSTHASFERVNTTPAYFRARNFVKTRVVRRLNRQM